MATVSPARTSRPRLRARRTAAGRCRRPRRSPFLGGDSTPVRPFRLRGCPLEARRLVRSGSESKQNTHAFLWDFRGNVYTHEPYAIKRQNAQLFAVARSPMSSSRCFSCAAASCVSCTRSNPRTCSGALASATASPLFEGVRAMQVPPIGATHASIVFESPRTVQTKRSNRVARRFFQASDPDSNARALRGSSRSVRGSAHDRRVAGR